MLSLAAGIGLFAFGDLSYSLTFLPTWSPDAAYLSGYPFLLFVVVRASRLDGEPLRWQLVDAAYLFLAVFSLLWFLDLDAAIAVAGSLRDRALTVAYPALDLMLFSLVVRWWIAGKARSTGARLLLLSFSLMLGADIVWRELLAQNGWISQWWVNAAYLTAYVLWAVAALHPSMFMTRTAVRTAVSLRRLLTASTVGAFVPGVILISAGGNIGGSDEQVLFAVLVVGLPLLMLMRLGRVFRQLELSVRQAVRARAEMEAIVNSSPIPITVVEPGGRVRVWNRAAETVSGFAASDVIGSMPAIFPPEEMGKIAALYRNVSGGEHLRGVDITLQNRFEEPFQAQVWAAPLADGSAVALFQDVTEQRRQAEYVAHLASHDPLTGLPNRRSFEQALQTELERDDGTPLSVLICDLDAFKATNDSGGHGTGDQLLVELGARLQQELRTGDLLARLAGDEFAIVLAGADESTASAIAQRLLDAARAFRLINARGTWDATISVGIYTTASGDSIERSMQRADDALFEAKARGRNRAIVWDAARGAGGHARDWSLAIKEALDDDRLDAFLQPIVVLKTGVVEGYEVLCRMRDISGKLIEPAQFLSHAERLGLMPAIDRAMLRQAAELLQSHSTLKLFVNLSPSSFDDAQTEADIERILGHGASGRLGIEITEHTSIRDLEYANDRLIRLRALGATIAIDDFGLGFTSFAQLGALTCDTIKISAEFVLAAAEGNPDSRAIVRAIADVAHAHQKSVVAEGIENAEAAEMIVAMGIRFGQGWHYGRPQPAGEALGRRATHRAEPERAALA